MKESALVTRISEYIRQNLAGPVVVTKHADRITAGFPDLSVCYRARTSYIEVKNVATVSELRKGIDQRQLAFLFKLAQTGVPVRYVIGVPASNGETRLRVVSPYEMLIWVRAGRSMYPGIQNHHGETLGEDLARLVRSVIVPREG